MTQKHIRALAGWGWPKRFLANLHEPPYISVLYGVWYLILTGIGTYSAFNPPITIVTAVGPVAPVTATLLALAGLLGVVTVASGDAWLGGVALEEGAVGAREVATENLFSDTAVIDKIWADIVRARMLTAEEAFIGGVLIRDKTIDVEKINVTAELTAAIGQFLTVKADMIEANAIDGMHIKGAVIEGGRFETHADPGRGVKMLPGGIVGYDPQGDTAFELNSTTGSAAMRSRGDGYETSVASNGVTISIQMKPYPDPQLQDPELTARRLVRAGNSPGGLPLYRYYFTDAAGESTVPALKDVVAYAEVRVPANAGTVNVQIGTKLPPESNGSSYLFSWRDIEEGSWLLKLDRPEHTHYLHHLALIGNVELVSAWYEVRDSLQWMPSAALTEVGLEAWQENGLQTVRVGSDGENFLTGRLFTNMRGAPGAILNEDYGPGSAQGAGLWLSDDGTMSSDQAAIWATKDRDTNEYTTMNIRAPRGGELTLRGGNLTRSTEQHIFDKSIVVEGWADFKKDTHFQKLANFHGEAHFTSEARFSDHAWFHGWLRNPGRPERTSGANVYMGGSGEYLWKNTSVRRSKVNIETVPDIAHRLLDLEPRIWIDRSDIEMESQECADLIQDTPNGPMVNEWQLTEAMATGKLPRRVAGLVAEEVEDVGLEDFAVYEVDDKTGEEKLQSVAYDRLWTLLIPLVREQRDQIAALEARLEKLEG